MGNNDVCSCCCCCFVRFVNALRRLMITRLTLCMPNASQNRENGAKIRFQHCLACAWPCYCLSILLTAFVDQYIYVLYIILKKKQETRERFS